MRKPLAAVGAFIFIFAPAKSAVVGSGDRNADIFGLMSMTTLAEAVVSGVSSLLSYAPGSIVGGTVTGDASPDAWSVQVAGAVGGDAIDVQYSAQTSNVFGEDVVFQLSGVGFYGAEPVEASGEAFWAYDPFLDDYAVLDFSLLTKIEDNSFWSWVVGIETVGGGIIGGAAGLTTGAIATAASGGLGAGAGVALTAGGALGGSSAAVGLSAGVKSLVEADSPPPKPQPQPLRPPYPDLPTELRPTEGQILTAVSIDGRFSAAGPSGRVVAIGAFDTAGSSVRADLSVVPLPHALILLLSGLTAIFGLRWSRASGCRTRDRRLLLAA